MLGSRHPLAPSTPPPPPPPPPAPSYMAMDEVYVPTKLSANSLPQNSRSFHVHNPRLSPGKESPKLQPLSPTSPRSQHFLQQAPQFSFGHLSLPQQPPPPPPLSLTHHLTQPSPLQKLQSNVGQQQYKHQQLAFSPTTPTTAVAPASAASPTSISASTSSRKRSRHAWPAEMTREIINVLLDEFLNEPSFRTTIYRSREERDHRFIPSGRSILEEYNKVQNIRRRYFIPLSYLLQWDQLRHSPSAKNRQKVNVEKKLAKPLERGRLQMIFRSSLKTAAVTATPAARPLVSSPSPISSPTTETNVPTDIAQDSTSSSVDVDGDKPVFELDIFVTELKRRDPALWARGIQAFQSWSSRKLSIEFITNH